MTGRGRTRPGSATGLQRSLVVLVGVALVAATAFGLWHIVVGGLLNGNPRAGTFGLVLALASGAILLAGIWIVRRRSPRGLTEPPKTD
jgi:hypothetical protein